MDQCGMGQYRARGWRNWHHHMTMVMLAMRFMLSQQLNNSEDFPLLSSNDIVELQVISKKFEVKLLRNQDGPSRGNFQHDIHTEPQHA